MAGLRCVSVVIPSRDGRRFLARCLPAVAATRLPAGVALQVIVVDNGSSDGSPEWLRAQPGVEAVISTRPLGFAHANGAARGVARGDVVTFLNNDTQVDPGWLERPLAILGADPTVAAVGSRLVFLHRFVKVRFALASGRAFVAASHYGTALDGKVRWGADVPPQDALGGRAGRWVRDGAVVYLPVPEPDLDGPHPRDPTVAVLALDGADAVRVSFGARELAVRAAGAIAVVDVRATPTVRLIQNAGSFLTPEGTGGDVGTGVEDGPGAYASEDEVPSACGAALTVRRTALDAAGWFPDYYTMYYEDTDLCLRLRQAGGRIVYCPSSIVHHYHTGTNREWSPQFIEHVARSNLLFVARFGSADLLARRLRHGWWSARAELRAARGWRPAERWRAAPGARGTLSALAALPRVLADRSLRAARARVSGPALLAATRVPYVPAPEVQR